MKRDFPNILISFVFGCMVLILGSVLLMAIEPQVIKLDRPLEISYIVDNADACPEGIDIANFGRKCYRKITLSSKWHPNWLAVLRSNAKTDDDAWNPCYVQLQSDLLPVVRKVGKIYEIAFVSDIGKDDLP